jgi:hypothetical protein
MLVSVPVLAKANGITPTRLAIFFSLSCQCIASAALYGTPISSDIFAYISDLSLCYTVNNDQPEYNVKIHVVKNTRYSTKTTIH